MSSCHTLRRLLSAFLILQLVVFPLLGSEREARLQKVGKGLNFYSTQEEISMGKNYSTELNQKLKLVNDPEVLAYVRRVGNNLARQALRQDVEYRFFVVNTREINAFALPGGFIYVNRGLLENAETESELAGVLGHEIGHVVGRHSVKQLSKQLMLSGILLGASAAVGAKSRKWSDVIQVAGGIGVFFGSMKFSRNDEREADMLGVMNLAAAGYDPHGLPSFFTKLEAMRKDRGGWNPAMLSTHPKPSERIRNTEEEIALLDSRAWSGYSSSSDFYATKQQLAGIPLPRQGEDVSLSNALAALGTDSNSAGQQTQATSSNRKSGARKVSSSRRITVPGDTVWLDSGLQLNAGDYVEIEAEGKVFWKKNSDEWCDPDGIPRKGFWKPLSSANTGALIAKIGQESYDYFVVGSSLVIRSNGVGRLFLGINDDNNFDNRGSFEVEIRVNP